MPAQSNPPAEPVGRADVRPARHARGPDITIPAAASLAGISPGQAHLALTELSDEHLVTEGAPGRYLCHDLMRVYAAETAQAQGCDAEPHDAINRLLNHYLHTADMAAAVLYPLYTGLGLGKPLPGVRPEPIAAPRQAAWRTFDRAVAGLMRRR